MKASSRKIIYLDAAEYFFNSRQQRKYGYCIYDFLETKYNIRYSEEHFPELFTLLADMPNRYGIYMSSKHRSTICLFAAAMA